AIPLSPDGHPANPLLELVLLEVGRVEMPRESEIQVCGEHVVVLRGQGLAARVVALLLGVRDLSAGVEGDFNRHQSAAWASCRTSASWISLATKFTVTASPNGSLL